MSRLTIQVILAILVRTICRDDSPEQTTKHVKAEVTFSLKDQLFNKPKVKYLANLVNEAYPEFRSTAFVNKVVRQFPELELKQRIHHISECLAEFLPPDYREALAILVDALPPELDPSRADDDFGAFILAPFSHFVALNGCTKKELKVSLAALREMTKRMSAEDSIRYFINAFPAETLLFLEKCARHKNYHVRRLASEGTRAKLPWCQKLVLDYGDPLPILNELYADPTRYVTRSVANHMHDISKIDPDLVLETLRGWQKQERQVTGEMGFIVRHSLRTLVKQGHPGAMKALGFGGKPATTLLRFEPITPVVRIGEALEFTLEFTSQKKQNLLIDYAMLFASDGRRQGQKVFKLKQIAVAKDEVVSIRKKHPLRLMTTRRLFPGTHRVTLQINGAPGPSFEFELSV